MDGESIPHQPHRQDVGLYTTLGVPSNASAADIRSAFRRLSRRFHPDKHSDPEHKSAANDAFTRIKEAHEILTSEKLRRIYDEFGIDAARVAHSPGMDLIPYDELAARFRGDSRNPYAADRPGGAMPMAAGRDPYFTVSNSLEPRIDATGLVAALEDGYDWNSYTRKRSSSQPPPVMLSQVALSTKATAYISPKYTASLQYSLMNRSRIMGRHAMPQTFPAGPLPSSRGGLVSAGELALSLRRMFSHQMSGEAAAFFPLDPREGMTVSAKMFRNLSDRMTASLDGTYGLNDREFTLAVSSSRQLDARTSANISWATGAIPGVSFVFRREAYDEFIDPDIRSSQKNSAEPDDSCDSNGAPGADPATAHGLDLPGGSKEIIPISALMRRLQRAISLILSSNVWKPVGCMASIRMALNDASLGLTLRRPVGRTAPWFRHSEPRGPGGGHVKVRAQVGLAGWELEAGGGRRYVSIDTYWSTSVAIGTHGVILRLKLARSGNRLQFPIVLVSTTADAKTATIAAISTSLLVSAVQSLIIRPWRRRLEEAERDEAKRGRFQATQQAKRDAEASRELMRRAVQGSVERETVVAGGGLVIKRAIYGLRRNVLAAKLESPTFVGREIEMEVIEVADCIQALVEESRLQIVASSKSTMLGFWDPTALDDDEKALRIWYEFRGCLHECIILDSEPLELPLSTHRIEDRI